MINEALDRVQKGGNALHFVDKYHLLFFDEFPDQTGIFEVVQIGLLVR